MAQSLRFSFPASGVRFPIRAQQEFQPEVVRITPSRGPIGAGPCDKTIHVIDARNKSSYKCDDDEEYRTHPPYAKKLRRPVEPNAEGDFTDVAPGTRDFSAVTAFAAVRCTLAVWEHHTESDLEWYFKESSLELIPQARSNNAWMGNWQGNGFLEFGFPNYPEDREHPWAENFDAVAHETGHLVMKRLTGGDPPNDEKPTQYRAHEEAACDVVALVTALHFDSVVRDTLRRTRGQLAGVTPLTRMSEWGKSRREETRRLFNDATLAGVRHAYDPDKYDVSLVFSGAVFDALCYMFYRNLVDRGVIGPRLARRARRRPGHPRPDLGVPFGRVFDKYPEAFVDVLLDARDYLAHLLARAWHGLAPDGTTYRTVLDRLLTADSALAAQVGCAPYGELIAESFAARGIVPGG